MNIFFLESNPVSAARFQHDRHVVKMILESAQMLSTACHKDEILGLTHEQVLHSFPSMVGDDSTALLKSTHENHPSTVWARKNMANFCWLTIHLHELLAEYKRRFDKSHKYTNLAYKFAAMAVLFSVISPEVSLSRRS